MPLFSVQTALIFQNRLVISPILCIFAPEYAFRIEQIKSRYAFCIEQKRVNNVFLRKQNGEYIWMHFLINKNQCFVLRAWKL